MPAIEDLNKPVCRNCGSGELASIEVTISTRPVDFEPYPIIGWAPGDDWGDGESGEGQHAGVVCQNCYAQEPATDAQLFAVLTGKRRLHPRKLITTTSGFARMPSHPYSIEVKHFVAAGTGQTGGKYEACGIFEVKAKSRYLAAVAAQTKANAQHAPMGHSRHLAEGLL